MTRIEGLRENERTKTNVHAANDFSTSACVGSGTKNGAAAAAAAGKAGADDMFGRQAESAENAFSPGVLTDRGEELAQLSVVAKGMASPFLSITTLS